MPIVKHRTRQSITRGDDWPEQRREWFIVACPRPPDQIDVQRANGHLGGITDHRHEYAPTWFPGGKNLRPETNLGALPVECAVQLPKY